MRGLGPESIADVSLGDVWPCAVLAQRDLAIHPDSTGDVSSSVDPEAHVDIEQKKAEIMVPFHKLTQWLAYSLIVPLQSYLELTVEGLEDMTGLPEYRNGMFSDQALEVDVVPNARTGGLFVDFSVLSLRRELLLRFCLATRVQAHLVSFRHIPPSLSGVP